MKNTSTEASTPSNVSLKDLRLPANYGAKLGVKKVLTAVPVGKPKKPQFFRTHQAEDMTFPAMILEQRKPASAMRWRTMWRNKSANWCALYKCTPPLTGRTMCS